MLNALEHALYTVTRSNMVTVPPEIREKYEIHEGSKILFLEEDGRILFIPVKSLAELWGIDADHAEEFKQAIRELNEEHRREAKE